MGTGCCSSGSPSAAVRAYTLSVQAGTHGPLFGRGEMVQDAVRDESGDCVPRPAHYGESKHDCALGSRNHAPSLRQWFAPLKKSRTPGRHPTVINNCAQSSVLRGALRRFAWLVLLAPANKLRKVALCSQSFISVISHDCDLKPCQELNEHGASQGRPALKPSLEIRFCV